MAREYIIYTDESVRSGTFYGNFYGGALLRSNDFDAVNAQLREVAEVSGLTSEIKWQKVTAQYLARYLTLMDSFFDLVRDNHVKVRVMFTQSRKCSHRLGSIPSRTFLPYFVLSVFEARVRPSIRQSWWHANPFENLRRSIA